MKYIIKYRTYKLYAITHVHVQLATEEVISWNAVTIGNHTILIPEEGFCRNSLVICSFIWQIIFMILSNIALQKTRNNKSTCIFNSTVQNSPDYCGWEIKAKNIF